eukprot:TRINITY_DN34620_c0_g1_i1.p1 TRINITY_DN34620_c0_g1~~TRINITY_DN34620_c0_g1_i1.p1  ORF type:complete len:245 (+),score=33.31 TRINITY_DN34620_c0_g1_i1:43-735(+)
MNNKPPNELPHWEYANKGIVDTGGVQQKIRTGSDKIFELNVGGVIFETTHSRLTKIKGSNLQRMVAERSLEDNKGRLFFDRDGTLFKYILDYLRDRTCALPSDPYLLSRIANEANYFGLPTLVSYAEELLQANKATGASRIVEIREFGETSDGVPEILCTPLVSVLEPLYAKFKHLPIGPNGRDIARLNAVKSAESTTQIASYLHDTLGYRVVGYSNRAILMERNDTLIR